MSRKHTIPWAKGGKNDASNVKTDGATGGPAPDGSKE